MNRLNPFHQEKGEQLKPSVAHRKKQLELFDKQKNLYMDMLRQSREHVLKGDLTNLKTCYQDYLSESMNILQHGLHNHVEFYKAFPVGLSSVAESYGDFIQNIFEKMGDQNLITPFTQSLNKNKRYQEATQWQSQAQLVDMISSQTIEVFKHFWAQKIAAGAAPFTESDLLELQQALLNAYATIKESHRE